MDAVAIRGAAPADIPAIGRLGALLDQTHKGCVKRQIAYGTERNASAQRLFDRAGFRRTMIEMTRELND